MNIIKTFGYVTGRKLTILHREEFYENLFKFFNDCEVEVSVTKIVGPRSSKQNRYYFGVVIKSLQTRLLELNGELHGVHEIHAWMKHKFNSIAVADANGEVEVIPRSTSELSTAEFEDFLQRIRNWAHESLNIIIPLPNEDLSEL